MSGLVVPPYAWLQRRTTPSNVWRNRRQLLDAARQLFSSTQHVPLYEVARHAGVGQATLYRHFSHRGALADALIQEELDRLRDVIADREDDPASFQDLLTALVDSQVGLHHLADIVRESPDGDAAFTRVRQQTTTVFARPQAAAQAVGLVRDDLTTKDLLLIPRMLDGALHHAQDAAARADVAERCLTLLRLGYLAREALTEPQNSG
ncbi:TetR/AcrR family transcriptional regulator [Streptomyces ipomoeae]|uniref:TetR/AcrR family transcriptional regulator n=1 Tax=Streptomyces ipomoeae TaxID=103232 RepID=UPI0015F013BF|nr:TetR/AcrR family transcriptional regulator [Streptomyces ipomoeae]MDX2933426.1 TetR/AcrR family transcriptional regulator [Streptomyces ipomoeae]